ncbi:unnamed protein product [Diamesa serratosioi]
MLNIVRSLLKVASPRAFSSAPSSTAAIKFNSNDNQLIREDLNSFQEQKEIWIENFDTEDEQKLDLMLLDPKVFGATPRIDIIHQNIEWQRKYRFVSFAHTKVRSEVRGGGRKPWPQKGLGKARHGSIRSPLWRGGGVVHGPRSPASHFYMLPFFTRVHGLTSALSVKFAQDDLHIVNDLEIPTEDSAFIKGLMEKRNWGPSVLIIDDTDIMPKNITLATEELSYVNIMPVYGLNVYSMLKHDTLVLTRAAVEKIQEKIQYQFNRIDSTKISQKFKLNQS